eukprot:GHVH01012039.1.p1 GENE.GHVH01012039.1~~GHVH01012039.1.p1  ORF type:complete len:140 (+),score=15.78 GHVH01012039.1:27-446(+)
MATTTHSTHKTYKTGNKTVIVRKKNGNFIRPKSDQFKRVKAAWRKPRGIDSPTRRRFRGARLMPNRGYGNDKHTRGMRITSGKKDFLVRSMSDLEALNMKRSKYAVVMAKSLSVRSRKVIQEKASQMGFSVVNGITMAD